MQYTLVTVDEADFDQKKISTASPIGKALLGKRVGEVVDVQVPVGILTYEILDISKRLSFFYKFFVFQITNKKGKPTSVGLPF